MVVFYIIIKIIRWNLLFTLSRRTSCKRIRSTDTCQTWVHHFSQVVPSTQWHLEIRLLRLGFSETILVLHMVLRVMKSKSTQSVCTTDTLTGHLRSHGTHTTPLRKTLKAITPIFRLRRGFKVFQRSCQGCHGAMH